MEKTSKKNTSSPPAIYTLSVVIPLYNEAARLPKTFAALEDEVPWGLFRPVELIFVNDGSTDQTLKMIRAHKTKLERATGARIQIISYQKNQGKGYAVRQGMLAASGDYVLMMDADMSTPLSEVSRLQSWARKRAAVVIGTRKSRVTRVERAQSRVRLLMGRVYTWLSQVILQTWVTDFTCGFKLFRRDAAQAVFSRSLINRWGYDSEIIFLAVRVGYTPREVAVRWLNDERSRVHVIRDACRSFKELLQIRWYAATGRYRLPPQKGKRRS